MTRAIFIVASTLVASSQAIAQSEPPKPRAVNTQRVGADAASPMYAVAPDGSAQIDWQAVETAAVGADPAQAGLAAVLLAVRDGRWKAMRR